MRRLLGTLAVVAAFIAIGNAGTGVVAPPAASRAPVFVTLPMTNGFADATDDLVETQGFVHGALAAVETVRLVDRVQESDAVLTVIGRGTGYGELTAAIQEV